MILTTLFTLLFAILPLVSATAVRRSIPKPGQVGQERPLITPSPASWDPTKTYKKRGVISDLAGDVNSILSGLGSDIPSYGTCFPSALYLIFSQIGAPKQHLGTPVLALKA